MRAMKISGRVTSKERFLPLLRALSESKKTGALVVTESGVERRLYFEEGAIVAASSSAREESYGQFLVDSALIEEGILRGAEDQARENDTLLGRSLVDIGIMSEEEVQSSIRLRVERTIADILSCPEGQFDFVKERLPAKARVPVSIDTGALLSGDVDTIGQRRVHRVAAPAPEPRPEVAAPAPESRPEVTALPPEPRPQVAAPAPKLRPQVAAAPSQAAHATPHAAVPPSQETPDAAAPTWESRPPVTPSPSESGASPRTESGRLIFTMPKPKPVIVQRDRKAAVLELIEELKQESSEPTLAEPTLAEPTLAELGPPMPPRPVPRPSVHPAAFSHPSPKRTGLLVVGVAGIVVLSSAAYWLFRGTEDQGAQEPSPQSGAEVTASEMPPDEITDEPSLPEPRSTTGRRGDIATAAGPTSAARQTRTLEPASDSAPSQVKATPETPSRGGPARADDRPVESPVAASQPPPAVGGPANPVPGADRAPAVASQVPSLTQDAPASGTEPATGGSAGESAGAEATPPAGQENQAQAQPSGWQSMVFAPKPRVVPAGPSGGAAVQRGELVEPGPDVIAPVLLKQPKLKYPGEAKRRKVEAVVRVRVLVDEQGVVLDAKLEESVGYGFDEAALKVALETRFIPATKGTVPVKMWTVLPLVYRLEKD